MNWAGEIIVVDSGSTDRTVEISLQYNCKIIKAEKGKKSGISVAVSRGNVTVFEDISVSIRFTGWQTRSDIGN